MNLTGNMVYVWNLLILMGRAVFLTHIVATAYYFLAYIERDYLHDEKNWATLMGLDDEHPFIKYL